MVYLYRLHSAMLIQEPTPKATSLSTLSIDNAGSTANSAAERRDSFWCVDASPTRSGPRHELGGEVSQWFIYTACTVQC